jgi:predicted nucleic acid-binding protein
VIVKVVDASVVAAIIFVEDNADQAASVLSGAKLIAPDLLPYEIANVGVTKTRREPEASDPIRIGLGRLSQLNIELFDIDPAVVMALAIEKSLSAYDAAYLWLSQVKQAELVTFDKRLLQAASAP